MVAPEKRFFLKAQSFSNENDFDTAFDSLASENQIIAAAPCITHASGSHVLLVGRDAASQTGAGRIQASSFYNGRYGDGFDTIDGGLDIRRYFVDTGYDNNAVGTEYERRDPVA